VPEFIKFLVLFEVIFVVNNVTIGLSSSSDSKKIGIKDCEEYWCEKAALW